MSRRTLIATKKKRSDDQATDGPKRAKRNKPSIDEEVGEFIVVDTGTVEETGTVQDTGTVEDTGVVKGTIEDTGTVEDENRKPASRSVGVDAAEATLQGNEAAAQPKHQNSSIDPHVAQQARDALFALDSILGFVERKQDRPLNRNSLYPPSPDRERRQTRVTLPSTNIPQSTESSSGLADVHSTELSPPLRNSLNDYLRRPESFKLQPSPQEPSTPGVPSLKKCQPNPNTLPVTQTEKHSSESLALRRTDKPPQGIHVAERDCCSKFGIPTTSIGAQTSQPVSVHNLPPHHTGVRCLGTVRNDEGKSVSGSSDPATFRSHAQDSDLPDVPHSPCRTTIQNIGAGKPWTSSLNSHRDQPAQQSSKSRSDDTSKACQGQAIALIDPNKPQQSSTSITGTNNSFPPAAGLVRQLLPERNPHTALSVSNFPQPPSPRLSATKVSGTGDPQARHLHTLSPRSSSTSPPEPSLLSPSTYSLPLIFAIDNCTKSTLSADAQQLIQTFITSATILLRPDKTSTRDENYPASILMWRTLEGFYEWYTTETRTAKISVLKFSLLDFPWQHEKDFLLYEGDKHCFRTLKQHIWDCFWAASNIDGRPASSHAPGRNSVETTVSALQARLRSASNSENIKVAAYHQPLAIPVTRRHCGLPSPYYPLVRPDNNGATTLQAQSVSAQVNYRYTDQRHPELIKDLPIPPHHNSMWMSVVTGIFETSRTTNDKKRLRDRAVELIAGREDVELEEVETKGGRKRVYPDACGAIVDKYSAKGIVAITAHGFPVQQVDRGQGAIGEPYAELTIGVGQACVIHGSSTVLYYKPRKASVSNLAPRPTQPRAVTQPEVSSIQLVKFPPPPEITLRLQMDEVGKFSGPYNISAWRPNVKTTEFFAWFGSQTGRGGVRGPPLLTFTLKDAMPDRKSRDIAILNEDDFHWMRKHILTQFENAKLYIPGLKEFTVLVTDPGWYPPS